MGPKYRPNALNKMDKHEGDIGWMDYKQKPTSSNSIISVHVRLVFIKIG